MGALILVTAYALTLTGCGATAPDAGTAPEEELVFCAYRGSWEPGEPPPCTPTASNTGPPSPEATVLAGPLQQTPPSVAGTDQDADLPAPEPRPTWDGESRTTAEQTAEQAMTLFARPSADKDRWWSDLAPLLSSTAQSAYVGLHPADVPVTEVSGPGVLVDEGGVMVADVDVPTDVGTYRLLLTRDAIGTPWLVELIQPPPGLGEPVQP